jgi:hypothetical protein
MRSKPKALPVIIAAVLLLAGSLIGYVRTGDTHKTPVRVLLKNKGGNVIFSHLEHQRDYQIECEECHHDKKVDGVVSRGDTVKCGLCHPASFDEQYISSHMDAFPDDSYCVRCHHMEYQGAQKFNHEEHEEYADCYDCHHDEDIEPEPQKCSNCHKEDSGQLISMRTAGHERCETCHEDMFDEGMSGCQNCHDPVDMAANGGDYTACKKCHDSEIEELVPPRMDAFHKECMGCHREMGAGPSGPKDCNRCHISK